DLAGVEVAAQAELGGGAELAVDRTADLRRDALRGLVAVGDDHALDRLAVAGDQAELARAVVRGLDLGDLEPTDHRGLGEPGTGVAAEVGHVVDAARALVMDLAPDLLAAEPRPALRDREGLGLLEGHRSQVELGVHDALATTARRRGPSGKRRRQRHWML